MTKPKNGATSDIRDDDPFRPVMATDARRKQSSVRQIICNQFRTIRNLDFDVSDVRVFFKVIRKKFGLTKSPKKKGYATFLSDEERR